MSDALSVRELETGYGDMQVLWGINLKLERGEIISILGPNGAGKSTLLKAIMGLVKIWKGSVHFLGNDVTRLPPHEKVKLGLTMVPEGKLLFSEMTVLENLLMGAYLVKEERKLSERLEVVYNMFPILKERASQKAGTLSGGEQQMLAVARAIMTGPKVLLLDEPTLGLSPKYSKEVIEMVSRLRKELGLSIILVEEKIKYAMGVSDRIYVLNQGRLTHEMKREEFKKEEKFLEKFLGL